MPIRNYRDDDFPVLEELLKITGIYNEKSDKRDVFKKKIKHDPESIIVAEKDMTVIGSVFTIYDPWYSFIYHFCVHPDHRNQGIGGQLMDEAEMKLKTKGTNTIKLYAKEGDAGLLEFYKKKGWHDLHYVTRLEKQL